MVKKFRRAAAGIDEQLPSDLRPPTTLRMTCDYLFNDLIGSADSLGTVHHFVWDRTRAIRNDFSIQQTTKPADVEIAVECYERIARFHILSLHQFAVPEKPYDKYDWFQEREQLDRTLLSLTQLYDDNRNRIHLKNEAEVRAYCIIFQIQSPIPDLEDKVSSYPEHVKNSQRVRTALELYAAACNIIDPQGPLKPRAANLVAMEDWNAFFTLVESNQVSYLMACVAEIYFNMVRRQTLNGVWRAFRRQLGVGNPEIPELSMDHMTDLLRFDDPDQTHDFCEDFGFAFKEVADGSDEILDLNSVPGKKFPPGAGAFSSQVFSQSVVENKRMARTFPAVISGYTVSRARKEGLIYEDETIDDSDMAMDQDNLMTTPKAAAAPSNGFQPSSQATTSSASPFAAPSTGQSIFSSPFQTATSSSSEAKPASFTFGSTPAAGPAASPAGGSTTPAGSPFAPKAGLQDSIFAPGKGQSPFSGSAWAKPSASTWGTPSSPNGSNAGQTKTPIFSQSSFGAGSQQSDTPKSNKPTITSIHADQSFSSWGKSTTQAPSWSQPASNTPSPTSETGEKSSKPVESAFAQPTTQQSLPSFSPFKAAQPTKSATEPAQKAVPSFGMPSTTDAAAPSSESGGNSSDVTSPAQTSSSSSVFNFKPAETKASTPVFSFAAGTSKESAASTTPAFSFAGAVQSDSTPKNQPESAKQPLFSFGGTSQTPKRPEEQSNGDSVFSSMKSAQPSASKPFSFTSQAQSSSNNSDSTPVSFNSQTPSQAPSSAQPLATKPFSFTSQTQNAPSEPTKSETQQAPAAQPSVQQQPTSQPQVALPSQHAPTSSGLPKTSTFNFSQPNQPKKRSPLSQSFSAEEEQAPARSDQSSPINFDTPKKSWAPSGSNTPASVIKADRAQPAPQKTGDLGQSKQAELDLVLDRLADEIITDPRRGFIRQFIAYHARPIIMEAYEEVYAEEMRAIADNFRRTKLAKKYGRRWRNTCWHLRLARQGKEKRERRRHAQRQRADVEVAKKRRLEEDAVDDFLKRRSVRLHKDNSNEESSAIDNPLRTARAEQAALRVEGTAADQSSTSALSQDDPMEEPSVLDDDFEELPKKRAEVTQSEKSTGRRSHFLGFSMSKQRSVLGTPRQPSRSAYFRLKAMGLDPVALNATTVPMAPPPTTLKRARDERSDEAEALLPPKKSRTPPAVAVNGSSRPRSTSILSRSSVFQPSPAPSSVRSFAMSRTDADDDDLIARARAARQSLRQSTDPLQEMPEEAPSVTSNGPAPSTSLERARMQARLRAVQRAESNLAQSALSPSVPAYRLRESRFVPREHYGRAIERAKENVERRSRPASVISARDEAPTPVATQPPSLVVETSRTSGRSGLSSERRESNDTQEEDTFVFNAAQHPPIQNELFGFGRFSQPETPNVMPRDQFAFQGLDALANAAPPVYPSEVSAPYQDAAIDTHEPLASFSTAAVSSGLGGEIDTQTVSESPYLSIGHDFAQDASRHSPAYPDLSGAFLQHDNSHNSQSATETLEDFHGGFSYIPQKLEDHSDAHFTGVANAPVHETPIDDVRPLVQDAAAMYGQSGQSPMHPQPANMHTADDLLDSSDTAKLHEPDQSETVPETQMTASTKTRKRRKSTANAHVNPFAALADHSDEEENIAPEVDKAPADESAETPAEVGQPVLEECIPNGEIQDAQQEPTEASMSFRSTATSDHMPAPPLPALNDGPAKHTRSKSRDMPPTSRPARLSLEPTELVNAGHKRYSLRSSPIFEVAQEALDVKDGVNNDDQKLKEVPEEAIEDSFEEKVQSVEDQVQDAVPSEVAHEESGDESVSDEQVAATDPPVESEDESGPQSPSNERQHVKDVSNESDDEEQGSYISEEEGSVEDEGDDPKQHHQDGHDDQSEEEVYDEEEERYDGAEGEEGEYDDEEEYDSYDEEEDDEDDGRYAGGYSQPVSRGLTPGQMQQSGIVKGGTGQTAEDAFELSD